MSTHADFKAEWCSSRWSKRTLRIRTLPNGSAEVEADDGEFYGGWVNTVLTLADVERLRAWCDAHMAASRK